MKSFLCGLVLVAGFAASASASVVFSGHESRPFTNFIQAQVDNGLGDGLRTVNQNYDNWTNPGSNLLGIMVAGGDEIADDLSMTPTGAGLLDTMGLNVANANGASNLTGGSGIVRFYTSGGVFINGFNFNLPALSLAAGGSSRIQFNPGALTALNIFLPQNVYCSLQYTSVTFSGAGGLANVGLQLRGPILVGASTDSLIDVTTNTTLTSANFGGVAANTGLKISTNDVPAPGAFALIGLGGLIAGRRRR